jgi:hypothetical protein
MMNWRRVVRDYEHCVDVSEELIYAAMGSQLIKRYSIKIDFQTGSYMISSTVIFGIVCSLYLLSIINFGLFLIPGIDINFFPWWGCALIILGIIGTFKYRQIKGWRLRLPKQLPAVSRFPKWLLVVGALTIGIVIVELPQAINDLNSEVSSAASGIDRRSAIKSATWYQENGRYFIVANKKFVQEINVAQYNRLDHKLYKLMAVFLLPFGFGCVVLWDVIRRIEMPKEFRFPTDGMNQ